MIRGNARGLRNLVHWKLLHESHFFFFKPVSEKLEKVVRKTQNISKLLCIISGNLQFFFFKFYKIILLKFVVRGATGEFTKLAKKLHSNQSLHYDYMYCSQENRNLNWKKKESLACTAELESQWWKSRISLTYVSPCMCIIIFLLSIINRNGCCMYRFRLKCKSKTALPSSFLSWTKTCGCWSRV